MASLLITLDKSIYLAGDTVSGQVLLAVPATISGSQGISLHFAAFESLKSIQPQQIQSSTNIPLDQVYHTDVSNLPFRKYKSQSAHQNKTPTAG